MEQKEQDALVGVFVEGLASGRSHEDIELTIREQTRERKRAALVAQKAAVLREQAGRFEQHVVECRQHNEKLVALKAEREKLEAKVAARPPTPDEIALQKVREKIEAHGNHKVPEWTFRPTLSETDRLCAIGAELAQLPPPRIVREVEAWLTAEHKKWNDMTFFGGPVGYAKLADQARVAIFRLRVDLGLIKTELGASLLADLEHDPTPAIQQAWDECKKRLEHLDRQVGQPDAKSPVQSFPDGKDAQDHLWKPVRQPEKPRAHPFGGLRLP
jgi:hypothetical protein